MRTNFLVPLFIGAVLLPAGFASAKTWSDASGDNFTLKFGFVTPSLNSEFKPENNAPDKVIFKPSSPSKLTVGAGYGPFAASYGTPGIMSDQDKAEYGESKISDWQFRFFGDVHTFDFFYQKYDGYYIQNTNQVDPSYNGNIIRPDISNEHYGVQYFFNFHPNDVSVRAAFDQSSVQNKSGGGALLVTAVDHFNIRADSAILPTTVSSQYGSFSTFKGGTFTSMKLGVGGAYTFVKANWFASILMTVGGGPQSQSFDVGTAEPVVASKVVGGANLKLSTGYNSKKFFTTLGIFIDTQNIENDNLYVTNSTIEGSFWLGTRF